MRKNPATDIVQRAQAAYPKNLKSVAGYFGPVPYGKEPVGTARADRDLLAMSPQDLAQLQATDPRAAAAAQSRMAELAAKDPQPIPGQNTYEP